MAGDWLKIEKSTLRKPEILALAAKLHLHPDHALGMVLRFWDWVDSNSKDGTIAGVTCELLDTFLGTPGLAAGLVSVGWLSERSHGLTIPNFERHMGTSSKSRATSALRTAKHRSNAQCNGPNVTTSSLLFSSPEEGMQGGKPNRPVLPCDRSDLFPAAKAVVERYEKEVTAEQPRGAAVTNVLTLLDIGHTADVLNLAISNYARSCKRRDTKKGFRPGPAAFFSLGGEWEKHARATEAKEEKWNPVG